MGRGDEFPSSLQLKQYPETVPVVIDPRFGHGLPVVAANRVPVSAVTDLWESGESIEDIAYEFEMEPEQVDALCGAVVPQQLRSIEMVELLHMSRDSIHQAITRGGPAAYAVREARIDRTWP